MIGRILKKDLVRRKSVNLILFIFITLATVFLASSVNNIKVVSSALDYYFDYANVGDITLLASSNDDKADIEKWLDDNEQVTEYEYGELVCLFEKGITIERDNKEEKFLSEGTTLYMSTYDGINYCKTFRLNGDSYTLKDDEVAMSRFILEKNNLHVGDKIKLTSGDDVYEFTIKYEIKDAAFGSDMAGMTRIIADRSIYEKVKANSGTVVVYNVNCKGDINEFIQKLNKEHFDSIVNTITRKTYGMMYVFDMIVAGILIAVGICLILIAMLVLRFTIVFTIEDEYKEIGIMKATGFRNLAIRKLYLVKYFAIVMVGALFGLGISFPVGDAMLKSVSKNILMANVNKYFWINIICAIIVIILVMLFCYLCTRKLNKFSAVEAIRNGKNGERYKNRRGIKLHSKKRMGVPWFLGINDIASHLKRYMILMVTFCLSFVLISVPLNTVNTMNSREMVDKFFMDPDSAVYVYRIEDGQQENYDSEAELNEGMERVEAELKELGYDADIKGAGIYFFNYNEKNDDAVYKIMSVKPSNGTADFVSYSDGKAPVLDNEVAFSETVLEENGWSIGDTVEAVIDGETRELIISGAYSDYMQLGSSARLSGAIDVGSSLMFDYWSCNVYFDTDKPQAEVRDEMEKLLPDYEWKTAQDVINVNVGGVKDMMSDMIPAVTALLCAIIMLITVLMEKLFIVQEKGEIAMMKSIGIKNSQIRLWQCVRMVSVAVVSMLVAVPMVLLSNQFILKPVFRIMGADVAIQMVPLQVFVEFPLILFASIVLATIFITGGVRKITIREMNNLE